MTSNLEQAREALGARLRELRRATGLNGKEFAAKLGWYGASRVSKLELGQQTPSERDLVQWTTACNSPEALPELRIQLNSLQTLYSEWRRQLFTGVHARQISLIELDEEVTETRVFESSVVPGLLQTPEYARYRFERMAALHRLPAAVDEAVRLRIQRQTILYAPGKKFHFVLTEAALRYGVAPQEIILGQLEKLLVMTTLRNVRLGIIPFEALLEEVPWHGFWIHGDKIVLVETFAAELRLIQPTELELYSRVFEQVAAVAVYENRARNLILHIARTLPPSAEP